MTSLGQSNNHASLTYQIKKKKSPLWQVSRLKVLCEGLLFDKVILLLQVKMSDRLCKQEMRQANLVVFDAVEALEED
jgi:hypothetical protein